MFFKLQAVIFAFECTNLQLSERKWSVLKWYNEMFQLLAQLAQSTVTVKVSGTATASAAFTVTFGSLPSSTASPGTIGNFGSCSIPEIEFGAGFDGREGTSFRPVDQVSYNQTSADDIGTITDFICGALTNTAQAAAAVESPRQGIDADAFNAVFGIQTNFTEVEALSDSGDPIPTNSSATATTAAGTSTTSSDAATAAPSDTVVSTASAAPTDISSFSRAASTSHASLETVVQPSAAPTTSNNLQSFTGALGGISAPAVVTSGSQFQVIGNSLFNTKAQALSRSCDVQQNACANAANAAKDKGSLTVAACHTQQDDCKAASGVP
ncbi:hypothetical protein B0H12DRAFT_1228116 [Mycena haematopus]|nr:hypothetical protein B0H12DRAFT_1228116 [Mycena haematopus]